MTASNQGISSVCSLCEALGSVPQPALPKKKKINKMGVGRKERVLIFVFTKIRETKAYKIR